MKITFEGPDIADILNQVSDFMADVVLADDPKPAPVADAAIVAAVEKELRAPWPPQMAKPPIVEKPVEKPKRARTEKQLANDEKLRVAAREKIAAKKAAKAVEKPTDLSRVPPGAIGVPMAKPVEKPVEKAVEKPVEELFEDPAEIVRLRETTLEELRKAYANGHQQEVLELLSRFGDGAKSFRELKPEAFFPIREAIDKGALT